MGHALPRVTRTYQNHHLDSTRWEVFEPRSGDILVTTAYKAGTTWMQQILLSLLRPDDPTPLHQASPWVDARFMGSSKAELAAKLAALPDRRCVKSHLPLDGLPYHPQVRYVIVARDPRDVFMSLLNHYESYTDVAYGMLDAGELEGEKMPRFASDPKALFAAWISRGWFPWESEGWPFWSNLHHTQSYWAYRHLPNFLFVHYNDMLADLEGAIRRVVRFAQIDTTAGHIARTVEATTFANVKAKAVAQSAAAANDGKAFFRGGASAFFFKGENGRWRELLDAQDLQLYAAAKARVLEPECAAWLEQGGVVAL